MPPSRYSGTRIFGSSAFTTPGASASWKTDLADIVNATSLGILVLLCFSFLFHLTMVTPAFLFLLWLYTTALTFVGRLALRLILEKVRRWGVHITNILIIGTNPRAVHFAETLESNSKMGYHVVACGPRVGRQQTL